MQRPLFKLAVATALICCGQMAMADASPAEQPQSARLLTALALIVPQPYEINVDNSIPTDTRLSWGTQGDWERQLSQAAASAGLGVRFNTPVHSLLIFRLPQIHRVAIGLPAAPTPAAAPVMPSAPAPALPVHYSVPFAEFSGTLGPKGRAALNTIASDAQGQNVRIIGRPDDHVYSQGKFTYLADARANAIRDYLMHAGIPSSAITIEVMNTPNSQQGKGIFPCDVFVSRGLQTVTRARVHDTPVPAPAKPLPMAATATSEAAAAPAAQPALSVHATAMPVFQPIPLWTLKANQSISAGLTAWAQATGWKVVWNVPLDWLVPNTVQFQGDFKAAATAVIKALAANGADVRADVYTANKTLVVHAAGQGG